MVSIMVAVVIPARYNSTRFPGKPLANLFGKPLIQHVYERVKLAKIVKRIIVATDDERVEKAVKIFGGNVLMTSPAHISGSDRVAEVAEKLESDIIINLQGDEPLIEPGLIDRLAKTHLKNSEIDVLTARAPLTDPNELGDPNIVKVVGDRNGFALYFSRSPIPGTKKNGALKKPESITYFKHIGIYSYRRDFILKFSELEPTPLEIQEGLEQLRILEHGFRIKLLDTNYNAIGVDTPEDLEYISELMAGKT